MSDPLKMNEYFDTVERIMREKNSMLGWIRSIIFPRKGD
jgi:hypothetical protein